MNCNKLRKLIPKSKIIKNEKLSSYTTFKIGGYAKYYIQVYNIEELIKLVQFCHKNKNKYMVIGGGSNLLIDNFDGIVISLNNFNKITMLSSSLIVESGVSTAVLCKYAKDNGYSGFEPFVGIPGTIGGLVYMNAGVRDKYISELVCSVLVLRDGKISLVNAKDCNFYYKHSIFQDWNNCIILRVELSFSKADALQINAKMLEYSSKRKNLPKGYSAGCIFKNVDGLSAGKIIEDCGLKGLCIGDAFVSYDHANFIINKKNASFNDVYKLIKKIQTIVYLKLNIELIPEIKIIGDLDDTFC